MNFSASVTAVFFFFSRHLQNIVLDMDTRKYFLFCIGKLLPSINSRGFNIRLIEMGDSMMSKQITEVRGVDGGEGVWFFVIMMISKILTLSQCMLKCLHRQLMYYKRSICLHEINRTVTEVQ